MKVNHLFCGGGTATYLLARLGHEVTGCDISKKHSAHFEQCSRRLIIGDVATADLPPCDLVVAGPPCTAFSALAYLTGTDGWHDPRNGYPALAAALQRLGRPDAIVENTANLASRKHRDAFERVIEVFTDLGYVVNWRVCVATEVGVPQKRKRLFMLLTTRPEGWAFPLLRETGAVMNDVWDDDDFTPAPATTYTRWDTELSRFSAKLHKDAPSPTVVRKGATLMATQRDDGSLWIPGHKTLKAIQGLPPEFEIPSAYSTGFEVLGNGCPPQYALAFLTTHPSARETYEAVKARLSQPWQLGTTPDAGTFYAHPNAGCVVTPDGCLVGCVGRGTSLVAEVLRVHRSLKLDFFEPLRRVYEAVGDFEETARHPFNPDFCGQGHPPEYKHDVLEGVLRFRRK